MIIFNIIVFSSIFILSAMLIPDIDAITYLFFRNLIGIAFFIIYFASTKKIKQAFIFFKKNFKDLFWLGGIYYTGSVLIIFYSTPYTTPSNQYLLQNTVLIFVILANIFIIKKNILKKDLLAGLIAIVGSILVLIPFDFILNKTLFGDLLNLAGNLLSAGYILKNKSFSSKESNQGMDKAIFLAFSLSLFSIILLGPVSIVSGAYLNVNNLTINQWIILIYLGLFVSGIAYATNSKINQDPAITSEIMGIITILINIMGLLLGIVLFNATYSIINVIGIIFVFTAATYSITSKNIKEIKIFKES